MSDSECECQLSAAKLTDTITCKRRVVSKRNYINTSEIINAKGVT